MKSSYIRKVYDFYSGFYDFLYTPFLIPTLKKSINEIRLNHNMKILDIGVGTGAALKYIPSNISVSGIDISPGMLKRAKRKFSNDTFIIMDALNLAFKDKSFDAVIAAYVLTVVPDPRKMLEEIKRVLKDDGRVLIINHFMSTNPFTRFFEKTFDPVARKLGWRLDLGMDEAFNNSGFEIEKIIKKRGWIFWKGVILKKAEV